MLGVELRGELMALVLNCMKTEVPHRYHHLDDFS